MAIILTTDHTPRDVFLRAEQAVISPDKEEQVKSVSCTENGDYQVTPDAGKTLAKVNVNVDVPQEPLAPLSNPATDGLVIAGKEYYDDQKVAHTGTLRTLYNAVESGAYVQDGELILIITNPVDGDWTHFTACDATSGADYQPSLSDQTTPSQIYQATPNVFKAITKERLAELDSDFAAENIKKDVDIFGLVGTYDPAPPPPVIEPLSVTQNGTTVAPAGTDGYNPVTVNVPQGFIPPATASITTFTVASDTTSLDLVNPLGEIPAAIAILATDSVNGMQLYEASFFTDGTMAVTQYIGWLGGSYRVSTRASGTSPTDPTTATASNIHVGATASFSTQLNYRAGATYMLICVKDVSGQ